MGDVMQGDPADSVFFIEDGDCQVGYNQRRTADEDLISTVSECVIHAWLQSVLFQYCGIAVC